MQEKVPDSAGDEYAKQEAPPVEDLPYLTPDQKVEVNKTQLKRQRNSKRQIVRAGVTKNNGKKGDRARRKQAKLSRRINR